MDTFEVSNTRSQIPVYLSNQTLDSLKNEFDLSDSAIESFITALIERSVSEHLGKNNSNILSESETHELEDDLKGLGYI